MNPKQIPDYPILLRRPGRYWVIRCHYCKVHMIQKSKKAVIERWNRTVLARKMSRDREYENKNNDL